MSIPKVLILRHTRRELRKITNMLEVMQSVHQDDGDDVHVEQLLADLRSCERQLDGLTERFERS